MSEGYSSMRRRSVGPFPKLKGLSNLDIHQAQPEDILERMGLLHECLSELNLNCAGHTAGHQHDEYWGADISELICRCTPHQVESRDNQGNIVKATVRIKLETLTAEIDDQGEICAWIYEES